MTVDSLQTGPQWTERAIHRRLGRLAAVAGAGLGFALLLVLVRMQWLPLESVDRGLAARLNSAVADHPAVVAMLQFITNLGSFAVIGWLVAIATLMLLVRRRYRLAGYLVVTSVGAAILDPTLKLAVGRLRPVVSHPLAVGGGNSFPSGHALDSIIVYGSLLLVFLPAIPARWRRPVTVALALLVAAIGFTRLALGVHYLSDVLGAWCLGVAWLGITAFAFELWRHEHGQSVTRPLREGLEPEAVRDLKPADPHVTAVTHLGWAITRAIIAWVLIFGALCGIGIPLAHYHNGNGNILGDSTIPHFFAAHRDHFLDAVARIGSQAGNTHAILAVGLIAGAVALAVIRHWRPVVFLVAVMFGELSLFLATEAIVGRPRPDVPHLEGQLPTTSFPSGHVAATVCLYGAIAVLVWPRTRSWWRWLVVALAVAMPLWVAWSRLYVGMHHPTDVLGAVLLAVGWLTAMVYIVKPDSGTRAERTDGRATAPV
jgi:undecaprenyl-diphosphatase